MDKFLIREAAAADAGFMVNEFLPLLGGESPNLSFGSEGMETDVADEARFLENSNRGRSIFLMGVLNGRIIGTCQSNPMRRRFAHRSEIAIGILKAHWGKGYASLMLEELIGRAKDKGTEVLQLEVLSDNIRAIRLYEKFGFDHVGHFRNFSLVDGVYHDAEIMELMLEKH